MGYYCPGDCCVFVIEEAAFVFLAFRGSLQLSPRLLSIFKVAIGKDVPLFNLPDVSIFGPRVPLISLSTGMSTVCGSHHLWQGVIVIWPVA